MTKSTVHSFLHGIHRNLPSKNGRFWKNWGYRTYYCILYYANTEITNLSWKVPKIQNFRCYHKLYSEIIMQWELVLLTLEFLEYGGFRIRVRIQMNDFIWHTKNSML